MDRRYRHEVKHEISYADMIQLRQRLSAVAIPDPHAPGGRYHIRSLYFDTPDDKALREKVMGTNRREKFRIRYYNGDTSLIRLEKKSRLDGLGTKYNAQMTRQQVENILCGSTSWMIDSDEDLIRELYCKMNYQLLRPKTIVDYMREPYVFDAGNVRVTLDYDIRTTLSVHDFLDPDCTSIKAGEDDPIILEVKWDDFLPGIIRDCVQLGNRHATAFSKYAKCRVYG